MTSNGIVVVLETNYYQSLMNNRNLLIENVYFSQQMISLCVEKKIVTGEHLSAFKTSEINAERIDCIIQSLQMKNSKYFISFCEILMMSGQPLIAQLLQEAATMDIEIDIEDLLSDMPMLKKSLRPKDKEQLQKYISEKAKLESIKAIVTHSKINQRKESIARVTQIQQSWKFQKDIKEKEKESDELKEQLMSVEEQLLQKQQFLKAIEQEARNKQKKQEEQLTLASNFNDVNDRELQRAEKSLELYKKAIETVILKLRVVVPGDDQLYEKLLHECSEQQMKKYDVDKQMDIFNKLVDVVLEIFNVLAIENVNFEALKKEVRDVQRMILPQREPTPSDSLTSYIKEYQTFWASSIQTLQNKLELQENFIFGKIPPEFLPVQFQNIQIPSRERNEFTEIIKELRTKIRTLESVLAAKENDFKKFVTQKVSGETEIFLESDPVNVDENHQGKPVENNDQNKTNGIPFSYSSKYKSRPPRIIENRNKRTNVLKFGSVNFL